MPKASPTPPSPFQLFVRSVEKYIFCCSSIGSSLLGNVKASFYHTIWLLPLAAAAHPCDKQGGFQSSERSCALSMCNMCPRTSSDTSQELPTTQQCTCQARTKFLNIYNCYNDYEETTAYQLSQVAVDWSMKLNRNLAANCRNISDEVFPGLHLGDR